jgi:long-chain acyl-CoA synthetase
MFSMTQLVRRAAQTASDRLATWDGDRSFTWRELASRLARLAGGLAKLGVVPGDRVAILALNSDRYFEFLFGVPWAGAVFVPINTRLAGPEVVHWLTDAGAKVLFLDRAHLDLFERVRGSLNAVEHVIWVDRDAPPQGCLAYEELLAAKPMDDAGRRDDDLAGLFYTGGTTGRSKGVMLSHRNLVVNALQTMPLIEHRPNERILHAAPMFHIADGCVCMASAAMSGANYFLPGFEPLAVMRAIERHRIERMILVPTMINMLVNHAEVGRFDLSSLRSVLYGASPMPEAVISKALEVLPGTRFYQAYGQTETAPILTVLRPEYHVTTGELAGKLKSAGQAIPGVDIAIMDDAGRIVPRRTVGEVCARGPNIMLGYRNLADQTERAMRGGWLHTGDGGFIDDDGFLFIVDRVKDMIVSGGENVYSAEVENAIYEHPGVAQCAVIGVPSEKWGEQVHAIVVPKPGAQLSAEAVIAHCRERIAGFKCPRSVSFRTEALPLSGAGKILKTELRKPFWEGRDRNVN